MMESILDKVFKAMLVIIVFLMFITFITFWTVLAIDFMKTVT